MNNLKNLLNNMLRESMPQNRKSALSSLEDITFLIQKMKKSPKYSAAFEEYLAAEKAYYEQPPKDDLVTL